MRTATRETIETILFAVFLALLFQAAIQLVEVQGASMSPRLTTGDRVLVNKVFYMEIDAERAVRFLPGFSAKPGESWRPFSEPQFGDIVVFRLPRDPTKSLVKRVIGLPGDTVQIQRGIVFVNGESLDEPYVVHHSSETLRSLVVDEGEYFVLGDNRLQSNDSRNWGSVPARSIIGKAWAGYWPLNRFSALVIRKPSLW